MLSWCRFWDPAECPRLLLTVMALLTGLWTENELTGTSTDDLKSVLVTPTGGQETSKCSSIVDVHANLLQTRLAPKRDGFDTAEIQVCGCMVRSMMLLAERKTLLLFCTSWVKGKQRLQSLFDEKAKQIASLLPLAPHTPKTFFATLVLLSMCISKMMFAPLIRPVLLHIDEFTDSNRTV